MQNSSILPLPSSASSSTGIVSNTTQPINNENTTTIITAPLSDINVSIPNEKQHESHDLCLDDLLKESYEKLMKVGDNVSEIISDNAFDGSTNILTFNSGMAINSNYVSAVSNNNFTTNFHSTLETINEDSIKELLYGHVG
jgi:hypothetical protein